MKSNRCKDDQRSETIGHHQEGGVGGVFSEHPSCQRRTSALRIFFFPRTTEMQPFVWSLAQTPHTAALGKVAGTHILAQTHPHHPHHHHLHSRYFWPEAGRSILLQDKIE